MIAVEGRGDALIERRVRQQIARQLFDYELIERLVPVERIDHPVAPGPGAAVAVYLIAVRVGVTRGVQPSRRHTLAVTRACEQAVDDLFVSLRRFVVEVIVDLARRGR